MSSMLLCYQKGCVSADQVDLLAVPLCSSQLLSLVALFALQQLDATRLGAGALEG